MTTTPTSLLICAALSAFAVCRAPAVSCDLLSGLWNASADGASPCPRAAAAQPLSLTLEADGRSWRMFGGGSGTCPALPLSSVDVRPLQTVYTFAAGALKAELVVTRPLVADDLDLFARPVAYVTARVTGARQWRLSATLSPTSAADGAPAPATVTRPAVAALPAVSRGRAWLVGPGAVGRDAAFFLLAVDDAAPVRFAGAPVPAWWHREGQPFAQMLESAVAARAAVLTRAAAFDAELTADLRRFGGAADAARAVRVYRQTFAACTLAADRNRQPLCFSGSPAQDILSPAPQMLLFAPTLLRARLAPVLLRAAHASWRHPFPPVDLTSCVSTTNAVAAARGSDGAAARLDSAAGLIIALAALAEVEEDASFARSWWSTVSEWAYYLTEAPRPTLDANPALAAKTLVALASYARLADRIGAVATSKYFRTCAADGVAARLDALRRGASEATRLWARALVPDLFPSDLLTAPAAGNAFLRMFGDTDTRRRYARRDTAETRLYAPLATPDAAPDARRPFTIASFNIRVPVDRGANAWTNRLPAILHVVRTRGFDIMGMQEVTPAQRLQLDEALGMAWGRIGVGRNGDDRGESMSIYYRRARFACLGTDTFWLSETPRVPGSRSWGSACPRICTWGLFRDKVTKRTFRFYNTHLDHVSNRARVNGIQVVLAQMRRLSQGETVFLTGDFNAAFSLIPEAERARVSAGGGPLATPALDDSAHPITAVLQQLYDTRFRSETPHEGQLNTINFYRPVSAELIDYVFTSGNVRVLSHATCSERPNGVYPSDHDAVTARVVLQ
jgi:endonuclease/exonuclease/phosphatase family metal-dependent hydrolase